jgi:hypothetical protein
MFYLLSFKLERLHYFSLNKYKLFKYWTTSTVQLMACLLFFNIVIKKLPKLIVKFMPVLVCLSQVCRNIFSWNMTICFSYNRVFHSILWQMTIGLSWPQDGLEILTYWWSPYLIPGRTESQFGGFPCTIKILLCFLWHH